jgi:hypothetical protein
MQKHTRPEIAVSNVIFNQIKQAEPGLSSALVFILAFTDETIRQILRNTVCLCSRRKVSCGLTRMYKPGLRIGCGWQEKIYLFTKK